MNKNASDKEKEFTDAANLIEASMSLWSEEFDKWHDLVDKSMASPNEGDIDYYQEQMHFCLKRMAFEQEEAKKLELKISDHIFRKISEEE